MKNIQNMHVRLVTDDSTGMVTCDGLEAYAKEVGLKVARISRETGIARNTINKAISEEPIRQSKAEAILTHLGLDNIPGSEKVVTLPIKGKTSDGDKPSTPQEKATSLLNAATANSKVLASQLDNIFETANLEDTRYTAEELILLIHRCDAIARTRTRIAEKYGIPVK